MVSMKNIFSYLMALFIIKTEMALQNWESAAGTRWDNNCDFEGNHVVNKTMLAKDCGGFCQFDVADCTHFTFTTTTSDKNGTCWAKSGGILPEKRIHLNSPGSVCGYLVISWKLENDLFWSHNCNFPGNDIKKEPSDGKFCGELCKRNPPCNHFVWTNVEGQEGICWMKFDNNIIKEKSAVLIPGSRGAICGILWSKDDDCECVCN